MSGNWSDLAQMLPPLVMCLVLTGIHGYLGIHILSRQVIFVDLALAQIAALGTTCAYVLGYDAAHQSGDATAVYWFSLVFTLLGAGVFSLTRMRKETVPHEAFIGIVYATASAMAILLLSKAAGEGEHIKQMLVGNILLVSWPTILNTGAIYAALGLFHYLFRRRFFQISLDPEGAEREGVRVRWWDFLFYASFGVVVTSSVTIAGVLLVFTYLVVPATCAVLLVQGLRSRIALAWGIGAFASSIGVAFSYHADLPTGPAVVAAFAAVLVLVGLCRQVVRSPAPLRALVRSVGVAAILVLFGFGLHALRKPEREVHHHPVSFEEYLKALDDPDESRRIDAIHHLETTRDPHALDRLIDLLASTPSDSQSLEHLLEALEKFGDPRAARAVLGAASRPDLDPLLAVRAASAALVLRDPAGLGSLVDVLSSEEAPPFAREAAKQELRRWTGRNFDGPEGWRRWWEAGKARFRWHDNLKKYQ